MNTDNFLTEEQEKHIIEAIARAENQTSGEIRLHFEHYCNREPLERAAQIFHELGMDQTKLKNGVLIYLATEDKKAAIYAGEGIHKQVEEHFWSDVLQGILDHFKKDEFEEGISEAVETVGQKLQNLFPLRSNDVNELTDEISYQDNKEK